MAPKKLTKAEKLAQLKARQEAELRAFMNNAAGVGDATEGEEDEGEDVGTPASQPSQQTLTPSQSLQPSRSTPQVGRGAFSRVLSRVAPTFLFPPTFATPTDRMSTGSNQNSCSMASGSTPIPDASNTRSGTTSGAGSRASGKRGVRTGPVTLKTVPQTDWRLRIPIVWNGKCFDVQDEGRCGVYHNGDVIKELSGIMTNDFDGVWWKFPRDAHTDDMSAEGLVPQRKIQKWLNDFGMRFRWPVLQNQAVEEFLRRSLRARLGGLINRPRADMEKYGPDHVPGWAKERGDLWPRILAAMAKDEAYMKKCATQKKNRNAHGGGPTHSTGRTRHMRAVKQLQIRLGRVPTPGERLFCTHGVHAPGVEVGPNTPLDEIPVVDAIKPILAKCRRIMADLYGHESTWTAEQWDDLLAYLDVPIYKGHMPLFSYKTKAYIAKARRNKLRAAGQQVSDTSDEDEGPGDDYDDATSLRADAEAELRAEQLRLKEQLAEQDRRHAEQIDEINRKYDEWLADLRREAAAERFNMQQMMDSRFRSFERGSPSRQAPPPPRTETGAGAGGQDDAYRPQMPSYQSTQFYQTGFQNPAPQFYQTGFENPAPQFPQQGFASPRPQATQQNAQPGFENPPGSPFFEGIDQERGFFNDEENDFREQLLADDTGRNVANLTGSPRRSRRSRRRPPQ